MRSWFVPIVTLLLLMMAFNASAGNVPTLISYQGKLTDSGGQSVADGSHSVTFKLYLMQTGGMAVWSESTSVQTAGGFFNVLLGSVTPIQAVMFQGDSWLETVVNGTTLTPRTRIVSVPYAVRAASADSVSGTIAGSQIAGGAITAEKLAPDALNGVAKLVANQAFTGTNAFGNQSNSFTGDGSGLRNVDPTYQHVLTVAKSGAKYSTVTAALAAITDNSAANTYLVQVMPGTYTESVGMKPFVTIEGASRQSAKIVGNITAADNAAMEQLTITAGTPETCLLIQNASPRFTDCEISNVASNDDPGTAMDISGTSHPYFENCLIYSAYSHAVWTGQNAEPIFVNCQLNAPNSNALYCAVSTPTIFGCALEGITSVRLVYSNSAPMIMHSHIQGPTVNTGGSTSYKIAYCTDGAGNPIGDNIAAGAVTGEKLAAGSVTGDKLSVPLSLAQSAPQTLLSVTNLGAGESGRFTITNTGSTAAALAAESNGTGYAGYFHSTGTTGTGLCVETAGGQAGQFVLVNPSSWSNALAAHTNGYGHAIWADTSGTSGVGAALVATAAGSGDAVRGTNSGIGNAGEFRISNAASSAPALVAGTSGTGPAGRFEGNVQVTGKITKEYSSGTFCAALPIAYGSVDSYGAKVAGTPNWTSEWYGSYYRIVIDGESYAAATCVAMVTPGADGVTVRAYADQGKLIVKLQHPGVPGGSQSPFSFVVYKL